MLGGQGRVRTKWGAIGNTLRTWGKCWELNENTMRIWWAHIWEQQKKSKSPPAILPKENKNWAYQVVHAAIPTWPCVGAPPFGETTPPLDLTLYTTLFLWTGALTGRGGALTGPGHRKMGQLKILSGLFWACLVLWELGSHGPVFWLGHKGSNLKICFVGPHLGY
jgi:hypothetical protein